MLDYKNEYFYKLLIEKYGKKMQSIVAIEELSELIKEITKTNRGIGKKEHMIEEIADCCIVLTQLSIMCGLSETQLNEVVKEKLTRTAYRFGLEQNNKKGGL